MTTIKIYDTDATVIERVAENNDMTVAEMVELLVSFMDYVKYVEKLA